MSKKSHSTIRKTKTSKASAGKKVPVAKRVKLLAATGKEKLSSQVKLTKIQQCLQLLTTPEGATIDELQAATGWQAHSVRGFLAGTVKKKLGLILDSKKAEGGVRHYRVAQAGA